MVVCGAMKKQLADGIQIRKQSGKVPLSISFYPNHRIRFDSAEPQSAPTSLQFWLFGMLTIIYSPKVDFYIEEQQEMALTPPPAIGGWMTKLSY